jgi:hypothetical protein
MGNFTRSLKLFISLVLLSITTLATAQYTEVEGALGNSTKANANLISFTAPGETITGTTTGTTTAALLTSYDVFLCSFPVATLGIYENVITVTTSGTAGHTLTIRGLTQAAGGVPTPGTDAAIQTSTAATGRIVKWYSFGKGESMYVRVAGTASTTTAYTLTWTRTPVSVSATASISLAALSDNVTVQTLAQTTADTDFWIYDSNFDPVSGFGNDDQFGTTSSQSIITRQFPSAGTYYMAISRFNLANNQPSSQADEDFKTGNVLDFGGAVVGSSATTPSDLDMAYAVNGGALTSVSVDGGASAGAFKVSFVQINISAAPVTCGVPTSLLANGLTGTSANLSWVAPSVGTAASYDWEVRTSGAGGSGATGLTDFGNVAGLSATTSALSSGVTYNLYVRTNCTGADGSSAWAGPFTFLSPLANDACTGAITISCGNTYSGSTSTASADAVPNCHASGTGLTGVWFKYVGDNSAVTINLCNAGTNYDTKISVFTGTCAGGLTCYAFNDDLGATACTTGPGTAQFKSGVTFNAFTGTDYYVFIHGYGSTDLGSFSFSPTCTALCLPVPANETCASAAAYGALPTSYTAATVSNNCAAAAATAPTTQSSFGTYPDIWYSFVYPTGADAVVRVDLNGTATDVGIELYGSCGGASLGYVASVNSGTAYVLSGLGLVAGTTYYLQLYSPQSNRGSFDFGIYYEPCGTPLNGTATNITQGQADLNWTSSGTLFDIELGTFGFTPTGTPTVSGVANPYTYTGLSGSTQYTYYVRQDCGGLGTSSWNGPFTFTTLSPPPANDACAGAIQVSCGSVVTGNTLNSSIDGPATSCTGNSVAPDNWYTILGTGADFTVSLCNAGTDYDTKLDIYTGACGAFTSVGCNDDGATCGLESEFTWTSVLGTVYYIRVHGFLGEVGNYEMNVSCVGGPNTWIGNNNNWYDPANWSTTVVPTVCADNVLIPGAPTGGSFPIISGANPATTVGNLIMDDNAQLSLSGQTLTICNNFVGGLGSGANVVAVTGGALIMGGSASQNIIGNSAVDVLYVANAGNVIAVQNPGSLRVNEELRLQAGTFDNTAGGSVILGSTASRTANLNNFCGGCSGTYVGVVTAERFIQGVSGTTYNQHHIGSPVNTAAVAGLADDLTGGLYGANDVFVTPTPTCNPDFLDQNSNYGNVFEWEETGPSGNGVFPNSCYQAGFKVRSTGNLDNGVGYVVNSPAANLLDLTGTPNTGDITVTGLSNSNYTNSAVNNFVTQSGWNELANPYPSSVSLATQAGIDPGIAIWHTSGEYTGTFQPSILGANADLAPWQGFWARVTTPQTSPSFSFLQSQRKTDQNVYYMNMGANTLLMKAKGFGYADATYVKFDANATPAYDLGYDVEKILGGHKQPRLFTYQSAIPDTRLAVNAIADGAQNNTVPMQLLPGQSGSLILEAHGVSSFDPTQYIFLEDKVTATMQDLRANPNYSFNMNTTENPDRFVLHFTPAAQFSTTDVSCNTPGTIDVVQPGDASWSYAITDAAYNMIGSGMLDNAHPVSVAAPAAGVYTITMIDNNGYVVVKNITINGSSAAVAGFTPSSTLVSTSEDVTFTSSSANATSYVWEFGDGSIITGVANPTYSYQTEGTYVVTLTVTSPDGCVSTSSQTIVVSKVSSVANVVNQPITTWSAGNKVYVDFSKQKNVNATIEVYNILGQQLVNDKFGKSSIYVKEIADMEAAYIMIRVQNDEKTVVKKLFISNR